MSGHSRTSLGHPAVQDATAVVDGNVTPTKYRSAARVTTPPPRLGSRSVPLDRGAHCGSRSSRAGSLVVGAVAHLNNLVSTNVDAGVRDVTNAVEFGAEKIWGMVS